MRPSLTLTAALIATSFLGLLSNARAGERVQFLPMPSLPAITSPVAFVTSESGPLSSAPRVRRRSLLDMNRDGRVSIKDVFKAMGLRSQFGSVVGLGMDGRVGIRSPLKLLGDFLVDYSDYHRISLHNPTQLVGLQILDFRKAGKLGYKNGGLTFTKFWRY